jgi:hypothetical protein
LRVYFGGNSDTIATRRATDMPPLFVPGCDVKPVPSPAAGRAGAESTEFCYVPSRAPLALADVAGGLPPHHPLSAPFYTGAVRGSLRPPAAWKGRLPDNGHTNYCRCHRNLRRRHHRRHDDPRSRIQGSLGRQLQPGPGEQAIRRRTDGLQARSSTKAFPTRTADIRALRRPPRQVLLSTEGPVTTLGAVHKIYCSRVPQRGPSH